MWGHIAAPAGEVSKVGAALAPRAVQQRLFPEYDLHYVAVLF